MAKEISSELLNTILTRVGGPGNIASCGNCMTRLRLGVHDSSLVDPNIKTLEGVKGVILTSDQVQVVFGPGKAHRAAKAMSELLGEAPVQDAAEIAAQNKRQLKAKQTSGVQQFLAKFATIFTPLIPGFIAAGLLLGIATLIATVMHVPADAQGTLPDALNFMKVFSKGLFTFLVILVGYNAAQAFGGTGVNGAIIAALFLLGYNGNLNDRLARKEKKYLDRTQQLDLVIVVDRLLTGFDAPCLSTLFMDRPPLSPQGLIQAFSRTNRLFDKTKKFGQIVTFQYPEDYKTAINDALVLYSRGGEGKPVSEDYDTIRELFVLAVKALRTLVPLPSDVSSLSKKEKKRFIHLFRDVDYSLSHLKAFSTYDPTILTIVGFTQKDYEDYYGQYKNVLDWLKDQDDDNKDDNSDSPEQPVRDDYDLIAFSKLRIDFEYIVELLQGFVDSLDQSDNDFESIDFDRKLGYIREMAKEFSETNPQLGAIVWQVLDEIEKDRNKFIGKDVSVIFNQIRYATVDKEVQHFADKWFIDFEDVRYEAYNYKDGVMANESKFKEKANYTAYKESTPEAMPKFKFYSAMISEFKNELMPEIEALL